MTEQLILHRRIDAPRETVFAYLTDPERFVRWMGVDAEIDARPGGRYQVRVPQGGVASGRFVEVTAPVKVVFTWGWEGNGEIPPGSSRVEITLEAAGDQTVVRLVHSGLPDGPAAALHTRGWTRYLDRLVVAAAGGDPGPDMIDGAD